MRNIKVVLLALALCCACGDGGKVVATWPDGTAKTIVYAGYRDNFIEEYDKRGVKREEGYEVDNLRQGKWTEFDSLGVKQSEVIYYRGLRFGLYTSFHPNGQKKEEGFFADGHRDDLWQSWDENGKLLSEANYEDGVRVDPVVAYDQTAPATDKGSAILSTNEPADAAPPIAEVAADAAPVTPTETAPAVLDGPWEQAYDNGRIAEKGTYRDGQKIGTWRYYYRNGTKIAKGRYWEGDTGKVTIDRATKKLLQKEGQTDFGSLKVGVWQYWDAAGKPVRKVTYTIKKNRYRVDASEG